MLTNSDLSLVVVTQWFSYLYITGKNNRELKSGKEKGNNLSQPPTQIRDLLYLWFSNWGLEIIELVVWG